jgi:hypothetical protein
VPPTKYNARYFENEYYGFDEIIHDGGQRSRLPADRGDDLQISQGGLTKMPPTKYNAHNLEYAL